MGLTTIQHIFFFQIAIKIFSGGNTLFPTDFRWLTLRPGKGQVNHRLVDCFVFNHNDIYHRKQKRIQCHRKLVPCFLCISPDIVHLQHVRPPRTSNLHIDISNRRLSNYRNVLQICSVCDKDLRSFQRIEFHGKILYLSCFCLQSTRYILELKKKYNVISKIIIMKSNFLFNQYQS